MNEINLSLQNGDDVGNVPVRLNRADPCNPRPDSIEIEYQINGRTFTRDFENQAGERAMNSIEEQLQAIDQLTYASLTDVPRRVVKIYDASNISNAIRLNHQLAAEEIASGRGLKSILFNSANFQVFK
ncbi:MULTISPECIES: hypothetical protein [Halomonas]|uniref:hypothetical protein n=1 Tax=Halomonas TaxID=2745 RepID=UPI001C96DC97|nr:MULTISPECIES: hypothetical protein [Halomonas]MBY5927495.1 hypothetical protein [Halomonas sp. DP8Y7-3]MBY6207314.1 hypothetical protein [Halomonas sp. DP3Y7-2]MBY6229908.1 hypothetical protein [Halomonas sp. DP3Y7-1]MCA0917760.1 hypothetical protein [Halomonas denitrificans]